MKKYTFIEYLKKLGLYKISKPTDLGNGLFQISAQRNPKGASFGIQNRISAIDGIKDGIMIQAKVTVAYDEPGRVKGRKIVYEIILNADPKWVTITD